MAIAGVRNSQLFIISLKRGFTAIGRAASTRNAYVTIVVLCNTLRLSDGRLCLSSQHQNNAHVDSRR